MPFKRSRPQQGALNYIITTPEPPLLLLKHCTKNTEARSSSIKCFISCGCSDRSELCRTLHLNCLVTGH